MSDIYRRLHNEAQKMLSDKTSIRMIDLKRFRDKFDAEYEQGTLSENSITA